MTSNRWSPETHGTPEGAATQDQHARLKNSLRIRHPETTPSNKIARERIKPWGLSDTPGSGCPVEETRSSKTKTETQYIYRGIPHKYSRIRWEIVNFVGRTSS